MKRSPLCRLFIFIAVAACASIPPTAFGQFCSIEPRPSATLLIPYFEVDVLNCTDPEINTIFEVINPQKTPALAHLTLWSDYAVPMLSFSVYLAGRGMQEIDLRRVLCNGFLPSTGSGVSNLGPFSSPGNFPGCHSGQTVGLPPVYGGDGALPEAFREHLVAWLTGNLSPNTGNCAGHDHGDGHARGFITIDNATACNVEFPSNPGYYQNGFLSMDNRLIGGYRFVDQANNVRSDFPAVSLEADPSMTGILAGPTFYGSFSKDIFGFEYADGREPLPTSFSAEFVENGVEETYLTVWRGVMETSNAVTCGTEPSWYPLGTPIGGWGSTVFVDQTSGILGPPPEPRDELFGLATQRVAVSSLSPPAAQGWVHMNLRQTADVHPWGPDNGQAWVSVERTAQSGESTGRHAAALDGQCPATTIHFPPPPIDNPGTNP